MNELLNPSLNAILGTRKRDRSPRIFLVEDEAIFALDLSEQLEDAGYTVCGTADHAEAAWAGIQASQPDLVLMDVLIKGTTDGIETAMRLPKPGSPPVIFLTAFSDQKTIDRATRATPYGYLTKPVQLRELQAGIEVALYKREAEMRKHQSEAWLQACLSCATDALVGTDMDGKILYVNEAACQLLRSEASTLIGSAWRFAVTGAHPVMEVHQLVVKDEAGQERGVVRRLKPGSA